MNRAAWNRFAEKVRLAVDNSRQADPRGGTSGLELEFNLLDGALQPVERVGFGPESRTFADFLLDERLPLWARDNFQLEVFSWMIELTTQPCYSARATAAQARLLEGVLLDTLADAGLAFGATFLAAHGNIPRPLVIGEMSIPSGWNPGPGNSVSPGSLRIQGLCWTRRNWTLWISACAPTRTHA